ncbi:DUF1343 domain-containing protein [Kiritimatiellota bacterium B12222]|nr:DUF1343 domain-containing protein [Kiritimatiellota bacterium B12222]
MNGLDKLLSRDHLPYPGARVGFLGHHASVNKHGEHAVDLLIAKGDWKIVKLFSPEHGFFGTAAAGEKVENSLHPHWKIPVHSLYGENRKPSAQDLQGLDVLVVDLQDLGVRCYTYSSTLYLTMQACADCGIDLIVLDRPTPLSGIVDGPALDPALSSFVGMIDLPTVYGKSQGELASFLKQHDSELRKLNLQVFRASETTPHFSKWIPPSPAITSADAARLYPLTVWCEAIPQIWVERGTALSFQVWCMPDFPPALQAHPPQFHGVTSAAICCTTPEGDWQGLQFTLDPLHDNHPLQNALILLCALRDELGHERLFSGTDARPEFFDKLMGSSSVREMIIQGCSALEIIQSW